MAKNTNFEQLELNEAIKVTKKYSNSFINIGLSIGQLVTEKNKAYGDSFNQAEKIVRILYPEGIQPDQYQDSLTIIRVIDKLFRIATDRDALGESPWSDIAGYSILACERIESAKKT